MSPTLIIHGTQDEVIDFSHGLTIFEKCPKAVEPLWVEVSRKSSLLLQILSDTQLCNVPLCLVKQWIHKIIVKCKKTISV